MENFTHKLIRNMSLSEKVHFKRNSMIHSNKMDKNYLKIYEALESMDHFNKEILVDFFKGTSIEKYLSSEMNYLKDRILISLFNYNLNNSKRNQIQKGILMVEVLASRGYQKEAIKKIKSLKKTAILQEEFTWILRLIELEEIVLFKEGVIGYKNKLEELNNQRQVITNKIQNLNEYHILRQEIRELQFSKNLLQNKAQYIEPIINNPLIRDQKKCQSVRAKEHWFYINVLANYLQYNFNTGLDISSQYIGFMQKNKNLFDLNKMMPALSNYLYHSALTSQVHHYQVAKNMLLNVSKSKSISQSYLSYIIFSRSIEFAYYSRDHSIAAQYLDLTIELLEKSISEFENSQIQYLYMLIVRTYIDLKEYDSAMYYCNLWLRMGVLDYRKVQARLFSLIINYSLGHYELLRSEIVLLKTLIKVNLREKELINIFHTFFKTILKHQERRKKPIEKLQNSLKSINTLHPGYFDFISFNYYKWSLKL